MKTAKTLLLLCALLGLLLAACKARVTPTAEPTQPAATAASSIEEGSQPPAAAVPTETPLLPTATPLPPTPTPLPPTHTPVPPTPTKPPPQAVRPQITGPCYNPYYPVQEGLTWRYRSQGADTEPIEYTVTYSDVTAEGFTSHSTFPDLEVEAQWTCTDSGLVSNQFAQITLSQMPGIEFGSIEYKGVGIPPAERWEVGLRWDTGYETVGKMTIEGIGPVTAMFNLATTSEIVAVETVSVPAGSYDRAMRVDVNTTMIITGKAGDFSIPPMSFEFSNSNWHVKDVGLVKSMTFGESSANTTELLSIE